MIDEDTATRRLRTLLKEPDALKVTLPFHKCAPLTAHLLDQQLAALPDDHPLVLHCQKFAAQYGHTANMPGGYREPSHYWQVPVRRIEKMKGSKRGRYQAFCDDADNTSTHAPPALLLWALTKHERG